MLLIKKALAFATKKHKGQIRKATGLEYITHPITVSALILKYKNGSSSIEALQVVGLLHDVLEDTDCTYFELEYYFGSFIASLVQELTSNPLMIKEMVKKSILNKKC